LRKRLRPPHSVKTPEQRGMTWHIISGPLRNPKLVVNTSSGEIIQRMDHDEFGNVIFDSNPDFQPCGFAGGLSPQPTGTTTTMIPGARTTRGWRH
jgi:hypothetical protein